MKYLDSFSTKDAGRVYAIKELLENNYPHIDWQTQQHDLEDKGDNSPENISLGVPLSQYKEAELIYRELKNNRFNFETSVFDPLIEEVIAFRDERNWEQFHNPKDLALSLSLEASELLENFQWKTSEQAKNENMDNLTDELADVVIYALLLSHALDINMEKAIKEKISKNRRKYPVEKSFGTSKKYTDL